MGIFDKKYCDVCGEKINLLGNRKLADGNLCKECAKKLSPFFSERKQSTVEEIKTQLAYREENKENVANFNVSRMWGKGKFLFVDETAGNFMVNWRKNYSEDNPDVISIESITGINIDVTESRTEKKTTDKDGKQVSFTPPHYENNYSVYFEINVKHPYFDEIRFEISDDICIPSIGNEKVIPDMNVQYREAMELGNEMKSVLMVSIEQKAEALKPKTAVLCPSCGATTIPDAKGCCEYCGRALNGHY